MCNCLADQYGQTDLQGNQFTPGLPGQYSPIYQDPFSFDERQKKAKQKPNPMENEWINAPMDSTLINKLKPKLSDLQNTIGANTTATTAEQQKILDAIQALVPAKAAAEGITEAQYRIKYGIPEPGTQIKNTSSTGSFLSKYGLYLGAGAIALYFLLKK